ncbi:MAG: PD-(D/E)XK nuclease-like domain-containing protein, partial [Lachnospiraceae bacterium]|nr:PD-(D/E)XK nuclease-like domain-containing protein [Lachnospiraceae bacterium]
MNIVEANYYSPEMNKLFCSASQYLSFVGRPAVPGCEARTMAELNGEYQPETTKAMQIGSILDALWEGATTE